MDALLQTLCEAGMYVFCAVALCTMEELYLFRPSRVNLNFQCVAARFFSFVRGFIGAGGPAKSNTMVLKVDCPAACRGRRGVSLSHTRCFSV